MMRTAVNGALLTISGLLVAACVSLLTGDTTQAQVTRGGKDVCRATISIDRSTSVGSTGMRTMTEQIRRLFQPMGLYDQRIEVGFWSFSSALGNQAVNTNYNAPFHDHVSSRGANSSFDSSLSSLSPSGNTNYEQGFGYDRDIQNRHIKHIADKTDVMIFMTDGQPNAANGGSARESGRRAAKHFQDAGIPIYGGNIGSTASQRQAINYTITGNNNDSSRTFDIRDNYSDLAVALKKYIEQVCFEILFVPCPYNADISETDPRCFEPCRYNSSIPATSPQCFEPCEYNSTIPSNDPRCVKPPYSLVPVARSDTTVISSNDSAALKYSIRNTSDDVTSDETTWSVARVIVERGQDWTPLLYDGQTHRDNYSCADLLRLIRNNGECNDSVATGKKRFVNGETELAASELGGATSLILDDRWEVGTKLCYVLWVDKPTEKDAPVDRYSSAACVTVGKRPTFQVHGGDLRVTGSVATNGGTDTPGSVAGSTTIKGGSINRTFGSWSEYGVFASGQVRGFGSASGLAEGYPMTAADTQTLWSRLTFANTGSVFGEFASPRAMTSSTATIDALLAGREVVGNLSSETSVAFDGNGVRSGLYRKTNGDLSLTGGVLPAGKWVLLHVPNGTVTITKDVLYHNGPYRSIAEIPQLIIYAKNINIDAEVARVDAWLVAQSSDEAAGRLVTCTGTDSLHSEMCNRMLTVNGPVSARTIDLRRTAGAGAGQDSGSPAEIFNLRADSYLWSYGTSGSGVRAETTYTSERPVRF